MGKIKNQTPEQKEIHNRAVKIRKMTDVELVKRFNEAASITIKSPESPKDMSFLERIAAEGLTGTIGVAPSSVEEFLQELEAADLRGIGKITIKKISEFAKEKGYI